jgi:sortase family protein
MEHPPPRPAETSARPRRALPRSAGLLRLLRRRRKAVALLLAGVLAIGGGAFGLTWLTGRASGGSDPVTPQMRSALGFPATGPGLQAAQPGPTAQHVARPVALIIPAIGVRTHLVHLGLTAQGTLQVPSSTAVAGWYVRSPRPGQIGSSIIAGHIDSLSGPAVFYRLHLLRRGDLVYVRRAGGSLAVFRVNAVRKFAKTLFPTSTVYGPTVDPQLHLITCGGAFDRATGSYLSNIVVFTSQVRFYRHHRPVRIARQHRHHRHRVLHARHKHPAN